MTVWAMAAVDLVNPVVIRLAGEGAFPASCEDCERSFKTVMRANLTLFKTIIAGDSWGLVAVPVIEAEPWTAIIFIGALLTLVFGVLNLVVAVVVDTFAEQRQKDVVGLAQELDAEQDQDVRSLKRMFEQIDEDGSGDVTLEELLEGARLVPEFHSRLR
ncbi:unnamed protein product, partial [Polarella glacialis]